MRKLLITIFILAVFSVLPARAAELRLESNKTEISINGGLEVGVGDELNVGVYLDAEQEKINAVGAEINYPKDQLQLTDWSDGGSIINYWVKRPQVENGKIFFEGVILGAYQSNRGLLATLKFKALKEGSADVSFAGSSQAFIHDGKGTKAKLTFKNLTLAASAGVSPSAPDLINDTEPPEPFEPLITSDPNVFDGQYFLIFKTEDKDSGMDYFDVLETSPFWTLKEPKTEIAESPYLLKDQNLESIIRVRAVDKAGNVRLAELLPANFPPFVWYKNFLIWIILLLILIVLADIGILVWKIARKPFGKSERKKREILSPPLKKGD